jgi:uncharacterized protein (TIRG00374 family)
MGIRTSQKGLNRLRDKLITALKIAVSVGLIVFLFSRVDLSQVGDRFASANYALMFAALLLYLGAITLGCSKWYVLLRAQGIPAPFLELLSYTFIGLFFGNFLPTNVGGDVVRGWGLARYTEQGTEAAVSVVVDRMIGFIAFMSMAATMAVIAVLVEGGEVLEFIAVASILALATFAGAFALMISRRLRRWAEAIFRFPLLSKAAPLYERLSQALGAYRHRPDVLVQGFFISLGVLITSNFVNYLLAEALGGGIPLLYIFLFNPLIAFVLLIPISVGGIGVNQAAYEYFFGLVGVSGEFALSLSVAVQVIVLVSSLPGGILWWRIRGRKAMPPEMDSSQMGTD